MSSNKIDSNIDDLDIQIDSKSVDSLGDQSEKENVNTFANMQERLFEIIESEEIEDVVDLNNKFLS